MSLPRSSSTLTRTSANRVLTWQRLLSACPTVTRVVSANSITVPGFGHLKVAVWANAWLQLNIMTTQIAIARMFAPIQILCPIATAKCIGFPLAIDETLYTCSGVAASYADRLARYHQDARELLEQAQRKVNLREAL